MKKIIGCLIFLIFYGDGIAQVNVTHTDTLIINEYKDGIRLIMSPYFIETAQSDTTGEQGGELYFDLIYYLKEMSKIEEYEDITEIYICKYIKINNIMIDVDDYTYVLSRDGRFRIGKIISSPSIKQRYDRMKID